MPSSSNKFKLKQAVGRKEKKSNDLNKVLDHRRGNDEPITDSLDALLLTGSLSNRQVKYAEDKAKNPFAHSKQDIMTESERIGFCKWLTDSGDIHQPKNRTDQRAKIYDILKLRQNRNRQLFSTQRIDLNENELKIISSYDIDQQHTLPSFFTTSY